MNNRNILTIKNKEKQEIVHRNDILESDFKTSGLYGVKTIDRDTYKTKRVKEKKRDNKIAWSFFILLTGVGLSFLYTVFRFRADLVIEMKTFNPQTENRIALYKKPTGNNIPFFISSEYKETTRKIISKTVKQVKKEANGNVVFYNYLPIKQKFLPKTRLSDALGNIYLTENKSFVLPASSNEKPGTFLVKIRALNSGKQFNVKKDTKLFIIGWKDTLKYEKQYALTDEITGGNVGIEPDIDESEIARQEVIAKNELSSVLYEKTTSNQDETLISIPVLSTLGINQISREYDTLNPSELIIKAKGSISVVLVKKDDIAKYFGEELGLLSYDSVRGTHLVLKNPKDIKFEIESMSGETLLESEILYVKTQGPVVLKYEIFKEKFIEIIMGKNKKDLFKILKERYDTNFKSLKVRPFWMNYLPNNPEYINLEIINN